MIPSHLLKACDWLDFWSFAAIGKAVPPRDPDDDDEAEDEEN